ncbi:MAG TPA: hypothetical protein VJM15_04340 [Sphingomicrobium sp.]|nr:hypothetical protein [Sphingomicrobium sp.]
MADNFPGMAREGAQRIELAADAAAAVLLAAAVAYPASRIGPALPLAVAGSLAACAGSFALLRRVTPGQADFPLPGFVPGDWDFHEPDELLLTELAGELVLTDADRHVPDEAEQVLILEDILAKLGTESRVVRLFDPSAMPPPGQLRARIDRHVEVRRQPPASDSSQALHQALADLRRSLR